MKAPTPQARLNEAERLRLAERNQLALQYQRLCWKEAIRFYRNRPLARRLGEVADLAQMANIALLRAADVFDKSRGLKFITLATRVIRNHLDREICEAAFIRVPGYQSACLQDPKLANPHTAKAAQALEWGHLPTGVDSITEDPGDADETLQDQVDKLRRAWPRLVPEDRWLLCERFGLRGQEPQKLDQIGKKLGVTCERARQKIERALTRVRCEAETAEPRD